jgi:hypothetical protein
MSPNEIDDDHDPDDFEPDPFDIISGDIPEWNLPDEYKSDEQLELELEMAAEMQQQFREEVLDPELKNFFVDIFANAIQIEDKIGDIICHHFCDLEQITSFQISIISRLGFAPKIGILREILTEYDDLKNFNCIIKKINFIREVRNGFAHRKQGWISHGNDAESFTITLTKYEQGKKRELVLDKKKRDQIRNYIDACDEDLKMIDSEIRTKRNHNS